jgi:Na+/proline symporter
MQFTPQELKMIERLRKGERSWLRWRWIIFCIVPLSLVYVGCFIYIVSRMLDSKTISETQTAMLIAVFWPQVLLVVLVVAALTGLAIRDWHGRAHRVLLLKLIESHEKESKQDQKT